MMNKLAITLILVALPAGAIYAAEKKTGTEVSRVEVIEKHSKGAEQVAGEQDELSADVQQLAMEQTEPRVIELFDEIESIMDEATDHLLEPDTGGFTIAAQTEVIEKIHQAAKERQKQQGSGQAGGAMMDMLERMMGQEPGQAKDGKPQGSDTPGTGNKSAESNTQNEAISGAGGENLEKRKVPKASGAAGRALPSEFQKALDAYNRGLGSVK